MEKVQIKINNKTKTVDLPWNSSRPLPSKPLQSCWKQSAFYVIRC